MAEAAPPLTPAQRHALALLDLSSAQRAERRSRAGPYAAMMLAALRGDPAETIPLIETTIAEATVGGQGHAVTCAHWTAARGAGNDGDLVGGSW